ncbi:phosphotransferase [Candidatus Nomurabacteria bacterium]|nr:phosphotransferase [Candidatus Nomurabacteria bacterium]MCB9820485.1 phosphotransferase [Candidatus Nomurabacteria bacterium]
MNTETLKDFIETHWGFEEVVLELLQNKGDRFVYKIISKEGNFVIKISDTEKTVEQFKKDLYMLEYGPRIGFDYVPKIIETKDGSSYLHFQNRFLFIMAFLSGESPENNPLDWHKIGALTARLHNIKNYKYTIDFNPLDKKGGVDEFSQALSFGKEYRELFATLPDFSNLPKTPIHTDIGLHNSIKKENGEIIFIDWDDAGIGLRILDIGFPLLSQFVDENNIIHTQNAKAFYSSYFENVHIPVSENEKRMIFDASLFFALIYLRYSDVDKTWQRIQWALSHREEIESVLF